MEDKVSRFELLLIKEFESGLDPGEKSELTEFLKDAENQILYEEQKNLWASTEDLQKMKSINTKKALLKIENQLFGRTVFRKIHVLQRIAAFLFIPLLIASAWFFYDTRMHQQKQMVYNTVEIPSGTKSKLTLSDGTIVWLNAGSKLTYPISFGYNTREVELHGEAFFEVTKNNHKPFIVSTENLNIKVLGTKFNCNAFDDNLAIETALVEGKVEISGKKGESKFELAPGELAVFKKESKTITKHETSLDKYIAWKSGKLMFRDDSMQTVIDKLGHWYGVEFKVVDRELYAYKYSATFSTESLDQVLKMLCLSAPIHFEFVNRTSQNNDEMSTQIIILKKIRRKENMRKEKECLRHSLSQ